MVIQNSRLYGAVREFMGRDYSLDVAELNQSIRKSGSPSAMLRPEMPPIPFTGNPWTKQVGNCTVLFSINPKWHEPGSKQFEKEFRKSIRLVDKYRSGVDSAFDEYLKLRTDYFSSGMAYGGHFTYLENRFRENWYNVTDVWSSHVLCMDCLPWFSDNTNNIDNENLRDAYSANDALLAYKRIIEEVISMTCPSRIQINGKTTRVAFEEIFGDNPMQRFPKWGMHAGEVNIAGMKIPVLAHNFGKSMSGPNSKEDWSEMAAVWEQWLLAQQ